jgi:prepilin-type N-terminal cleavage/methylation domain-containing protein
MKYQTQQGFTLVETLVAIFILVMSITGPLFIAQQSFTSAATARERTTASFLAQEGIEYVRSVRDHNYLAGNDWMQSLTPCIGKTCTVDSVTRTYPTIATCSGACPAFKKSVEGLFGYQAGEPTNFIREISLTEISAHEMQVNVTVTWTHKGVTRDVIVEERLFNWL